MDGQMAEAAAAALAEAFKKKKKKVYCCSTHVQEVHLEKITGNPVVVELLQLLGPTFNFFENAYHGLVINNNQVKRLSHRNK